MAGLKEFLLALRRIRIAAGGRRRRITRDVGRYSFHYPFLLLQGGAPHRAESRVAAENRVSGDRRGSIFLETRGILIRVLCCIPFRFHK